MARFSKRLKHAWNVFSNAEQERKRGSLPNNLGASYSRSPTRPRMYMFNETTIISSIYTRIGIDAASWPMKHVRLDDQNRYLEDIKSGLQSCLTLEANVDQAATQFRQDVIMTLIERGTVAIVPVDTTISPFTSGGFDIKTLRVGHITQWYPQHIRAMVYNDKTGIREEIMLPKAQTAIIENPLYSIMNETNSTLQRLIRKLNLLDDVDEQSSSGKLDIIIQLPYTIKSEAKRQQAQQRREDIEFQLRGSQYGIAYADATEKITQLNRPATNNLMDQVQYLVNLLYAQLGLTPEVMNGTADEPTMLNYWNRTIEPILTATVEAMIRTFLTKTARSQQQSIRYFRDPFKLIPIGGEGGIADIADKLSRNEIVTPNEFRNVLGLPPDSNPKSDQLQNSNMPQPPDNTDSAAPQDPPEEPDPNAGNG